MALKDILVHIDHGKGNASRLEFAVRIAKEHEAHLTAIYVPMQLHVPAYGGMHIPAEVIQNYDKQSERNTQKAHAMFDEAIGQTDLEAQWREQEGNVTDVLNLNARYTDLVVLGQAEDYLPLVDEPVVDQVTLSCGRPVLVVPYIGAGNSSGRRIYVAWDGSREAVRAVNDAMVFLKRADEVKVIAVNPKKGRYEHGEIPCADICLHLARHGVKATAYPVESGNLSVGDTLLSRAADDSVDMIVMGAYAHSRLRELVLGGATQHILEHMTMPVLMSH